MRQVGAVKVFHMGFARVSRWGWLLSWVLAVSPWVSAQEVFTVKRDVELREGPQANAKSTRLPADTTVTRLDDRQGPFRRVRTSDGKIGWLHMFDLQGNAPAAATTGNSGTSALRSLGQAFSPSGATSGTVATSTVGIRGLDADDLAKASPNLQAVDAAGQYKVSEAQARQFAQRAGFKSRQVADLDPVTPTAPASAIQAQ